MSDAAILIIVLVAVLLGDLIVRLEIRRQDQDGKRKDGRP